MGSPAYRARRAEGERRDRRAARGMKLAFVLAVAGLVAWTAYDARVAGTPSEDLARCAPGLALPCVIEGREGRLVADLTRDGERVVLPAADWDADVLSGGHAEDPGPIHPGAP